MVRDQILGMVRGFSGSKQKRQDLQHKIESLGDISQYIDNLESYFAIQGIESIPNIIPKANKVSLPVL